MRDLRPRPRRRPVLARQLLSQSTHRARKGAGVGPPEREGGDGVASRDPLAAAVRFDSFRESIVDASVAAVGGSRMHVERSRPASAYLPVLFLLALAASTANAQEAENEDSFRKIDIDLGGAAIIQ